MPNPRLQRLVLWLDRWTPDDVGFRGKQLSVCQNLVPYGGESDYQFSSQLVDSDPTRPPPARVEGSLHYHVYSASPSVVRLYYGTATRLYEHIFGTSQTDVSRAALYTTTPITVADAYGWWMTSFGDNVVATNYNDEVQVQVAAAGLFANLITSTFAPRAKFCATIRDNLFLANCNLPAPYDGLSAGANPFLVAWSRNGVISSFGSLNADPQITGAGYQQVNNDSGAITGFVGGDWGLVFQERRITRIDGPPYSLRAIVSNDGTPYPRSVFRVGDDVYFWSTTHGPSVLRGGLPPVEILGKGQWMRYLSDNVFFANKTSLTPAVAGMVSGFYNTASRCVCWGLTDENENFSKRMIVISIDDGRASIIDGIAPDISSGIKMAFYADETRTGILSHLGRALRGITCYVEHGAGPTRALFRSTITSYFDPAQAGTFLPQARWPYRVMIDGRASRIRRVRPLLVPNPAYSEAVSGYPVVTAIVQSKNDPRELDFSRQSISTTRDSEGWITFTAPENAMAGLHQVQLNFQGASTGSPTTVPAYFTPLGVELEVEEGPEFGA